MAMLPPRAFGFVGNTAWLLEMTGYVHWTASYDIMIASAIFG
jgi:hypothetical protein